jgi:hypothetical protein
VVREAHLANSTSAHCTTHLCSFRAIAQKVISSTLEESRYEMMDVPSLLVDPNRFAAQASHLQFDQSKGASVGQLIETLLRRVIRVCATRVPSLHLTLSALHPDA